MYFKNFTQFSCRDESECSISGICSANSGFSSFQEILILYIKEIAFYLLKLKNFGIKNDVIRDDLLNILFSIATNVIYENDDFTAIACNLRKIKKQAKTVYEKACLERELTIEKPSFYFKHAKNYTLVNATMKGEKFFLKNIMNMNDTARGFYDILIFLSKSFVIKIIEMQRLGGDYDEAYYKLLTLLNVMFPAKFNSENVQKTISDSLENFYQLSEDIFNLREKKYGKPELTSVSLSSREGKAIMVAGKDIKKLEEVLQAAKNQNIDVYTQGLELLCAHAYPKIKAYPNLYGHFGENQENCINDFSVFPGVTLLSKDSLDCIEYLFRGRLFTIDPIASKGITKIENKNYRKLINDANMANGFKHCHKKGELKVGFDENSVINDIEKIVDRLINKDIKHLYIIGLRNYNKEPEGYFKDFFEILPEDCYAISFAYKSDKPNVYHLDSIFDYLLFHKLINKMNEKTDIKNLNLSVFVTKADKQVIYNLLYLKHLGVKNVYLSDLSLSFVSSYVFEILEKYYDIKKISTPEIDIENTLN